ncbi:hypothetical protein GN956_G12493 [Arapaima gigas]
MCSREASFRSNGRMFLSRADILRIRQQQPTPLPSQKPFVCSSLTINRLLGAKTRESCHLLPPPHSPTPPCPLLSVCVPLPL